MVAFLVCGHRTCFPCYESLLASATRRDENFGRRAARCPLCKSDIDRNSVRPVTLGAGGGGKLPASASSGAARAAGGTAFTSSSASPLPKENGHSSFSSGSSSSAGGTPSSAAHIRGNTATAAAAAAASSASVNVFGGAAAAGGASAHVRVVDVPLHLQSLVRSPDMDEALDYVTQVRSDYILFFLGEERLVRFL